MRIEISPPRSADAAVAFSEAARSTMACLVESAGHDLRQPLQVAILSIARAVGEGVEPKAAERLATAMDALKRLASELDNMTEIACGDAFPGPKLTDVSLDAVIEMAERDWRPYAEHCGIALHVRPTGKWVETDPRMIRSLVRCLIGNAIKQSGPGGLVQVAMREAGTRVRLDVRDTGRGMPRDRLEELEDLFSGRRHPRDVDGLDLHLRIAHRAAELLGHPVLVRSVPEMGSIFSIELPLATTVVSPVAEVVPIAWPRRYARELAAD